MIASGLLSVASVHAAETDRVTILKTPNGGIQPQAAIGRDGTIHLIYFRGEPYQGDLEYVNRGPEESEFSRPVRVNSQPGSAIAVGTIRGGQIALGKNDRVHVAWNGTNASRTKDQRHEGVPMFYARLNDARTAFEPQRDLMTETSALDGGGTVAADTAGNACVVWHARGPNTTEGEQNRRLWIARSTDDGKTFSPEAPAFTEETGACGCCGTRALADRRGSLYLMYRAATRGTERDMYLLTSKGATAPFRGKSLGPWKVNICPMSSESLADAGRFVLASWETRGEVAYVRVDPRNGSASAPISPPGPARERKHPAVAGNEKGDVLLVWTEGTGWQKGGSLAWQVFDQNGEATSEKGRIRNGVPVWGLATAVALHDGKFVIIY
jgi:hypothetical protein